MKISTTLVAKIIIGILSVAKEYPEFLVQWADVVAEWKEARSPESEGGVKVTLSELFNEILPEVKEAMLVFVPELDEFLGSLKGEEEDE